MRKQIVTILLGAAVMLGTATTLFAQNGLPTGGERPVAGGANGGGPYYGQVYRYGYAYQPYRHLYGYYGPYRHHRYRHY